MVERLSDYPYVLVRVACDLCRRRGTYKLARLATKYGSETPMGAVLDGLAYDCPWRRFPGEPGARQYEAKCGAHFPDIDRPPRPPDLPPALAGFRVIRGGKR